MSSLYFLISSLFYNLLVTIIYFHKERIKTKENIEYVKELLKKYNLYDFNIFIINNN